VCANPIGSSSESSETLTRTEQVYREDSISNTNRRNTRPFELFSS
jgi:hypothetical protein